MVRDWFIFVYMMSLNLTFELKSMLSFYLILYARTAPMWR